MNQIVSGKIYNCGMINYDSLELLFQDNIMSKDGLKFEFEDLLSCCYDMGNCADGDCIAGNKFETLLCSCENFNGEQCICGCKSVNVKVEIQFEKTECNEINLTTWFDSVLIFKNLKIFLEKDVDEDKLTNEYYLTFDEDYDIIIKTIKIEQKRIKLQNKLKHINYILYQSKLDGNCRDIIMKFVY